MSMLAEPKRKQKWSLNPRGKDWAEDSNKFGERLLKKMGWSPGKGLGAKEDGMKEHIKVSYKNDSTGIGYKENSDQWLEHTTQFNDLLQSLTSNGQQESHSNNDNKRQSADDDNNSSSCATAEQPQKHEPLKSLVEKSKKSKKRMHYQKLVRGKDLSRCSEKDLAQIFGRATTVPRSKGNLDDDSPSDRPEETGTEELKAGNSFMFTGGTITDYFKRKLPNLGWKSSATEFVIGSNGVLKKAPKTDELSETEDETNRYSGFGFFNNTKPSEERTVSSLEEEHGLKQSHNGATEISHIKNKKRKSRNEEEVMNDQNERASKKAKRIDREQEPKLEEAVTSTCIETEIQKRSEKKKKKKKSNYEESIGELTNNIETDAVPCAEFEGGTQSRRKIMSYTPEIYALDNPNFVSTFLEQVDETTNDSRFEVKRKKSKKNKQSVLAMDNPSFTASQALEETEIGDTRIVSSEFEVKRSKKSKTPEDSGETKRKDKKTKFLALDNPTFSDGSVVEDGGQCQNSDNQNSSQSTQIDSFGTGKISTESYEVERPKKKKSKSLAIDNPVFLDQSLDEDGNHNLDDENSSQFSQIDSMVNSIEDFEVKRPKKKKSKILAIDNPVFSDRSVEECSSEPSVTSQFEVRRSKKLGKLQQVQAVDNPSFNESQSSDEGRNQAGVVCSKFEVERPSKKKSKSRDLAIVNPVFLDQSEELVPSTSQTEPERENPDIEANNQTPALDGDEFCDLMLNVVSTPVAPKILVSSLRDSSVKRRKSVRFSQTNQERIIPRIADLERDIEDCGVGNTGTATSSSNMECSISQKIEGLQAELENDLNEAKACQNNGTRLELKDAPQFLLPPSYMLKENTASVAKASYKHLIKGDIVLGFNNSNIDSIEGYGSSFLKHFKRKL